MNETCGEFHMIKYARNGKTIPHERVFKMDHNHIHVMWKKERQSSNYSLRSSLLLNDITEVRCGQQTRNFQLFPYIEVEKQSFSLIFEKEYGEWNGLASLDVICDSVLAYQYWKSAFEVLIYGKDDKFPYRDLYSLSDPISIFLKRHWSILAYDNTISLDTAVTFLCHCNQTLKKRSLRNFVRNITRSQFSADVINWDCFIFIFNLLSRQAKLYEVYKKYALTFPDLGMTVQEFQRFLLMEQNDGEISLSTIRQLVDFHDKNHLIFKRISAGGDPAAYRNSTKLLSFHGFVSYLRSADNDVLNKQHKQDMTKPLSHYFVNSSHNTYLTNHQLKGLSSCEAYIYALNKGCRCFEIDCWDGPDGPIVTHGMTWTSKILLKNVLQIIKVYGFDKSPYPIILSLENHCSVEQQGVMAQLFTEIFGDSLATDNLCNGNQLPSPEQLKYKVILKGNPKLKKKSRQRKVSKAILKSRLESNSSTFPLNANRSPSINSFEGSKYDEEPSVFTFKESRTSIDSTASLTPSSPKLVETEPDEKSSDGDGEQVQIPLEASMARMIVYCISVPFKFNEPSTSCCEMHSFSENQLATLAEKYPLVLLSLTYQKFIRTYPKASRVDSSNFNPMLAWKYGIQMAAINIQKPDYGFHVNEGFFLKSLDTGYILKPPQLMVKGSFYNPNWTKSQKTEFTEQLNIEILCGQFVDPTQFTNLPVVIEIEIVGGMDADCQTFSTEACGNIFNPVFGKNKHTFNLFMPSLCCMYVKVFAVGRLQKMIYQTCLPVDLLKTGLRYISMKTLTGVNRKENGIFVKLDVDFPERKRVRSADVSNNDIDQPRSRLPTL